MDRDTYLALLRDDSAALIAAARAADPNTPVPGCPEWTAADLVWHIGEVHDFWGWVVRERATVPDGYVDPQRPDEMAALLAYAADRAGELHGVLAAADPATPVWSWTPADNDAAWVLRRMAHETAVHRIDAEHAAGRDHRLDPAFAADGIDEYLAWFWPDARADAPPLAGSVHLHCTDADGEWTVRPDGSGGHTVARDHAKADTAVRGQAHDLLMALWRRAPLDTVEVLGDEQLATAFVARPDLD